jgi:Domain of unknown function (DUF4157)
MADSRIAQLMKHEDTARRRAEESAVEPAKEHPLVGMQKAVGNAAVARMLAQRQEEDELQTKHDPALQRQEEDEEVAQAKHDATLERQEEEEIATKRDPNLQREEEEDVAMKRDDPAPVVGLEGGAVGGEISGAIAAERGNGSALGGSLRDKMEGAFGTSFDDVHVHSDSTADALNRQVTAKAFTTGSDIFLRNDSSAGDENLMAHELTHVVQQRSMGGGTGGGMQVGAAGSEHEQEADAVAGEVTSGVAAREVEQDR